MYMYVLHKVAHETALRALAMLIVVTLLLWAVGIVPFSQKANASNVTSYSDTLSDSDLAIRSNHTIRFTIPNGMLASQNFTITFPTAGGEFSLANTPTAKPLDSHDQTTEHRQGPDTAKPQTASAARRCWQCASWHAG